MLCGVKKRKEEKKKGENMPKGAILVSYPTVEATSSTKSYASGYLRE